MDLGEVIRTRRTQLGMSQAGLAKAASVDARQIRRYETGEQQPLLAAAAAIAAALGMPLAELAGVPAGDAAGPGHVLPRVRQGIQFTRHSEANGELRITGDDDAALLLWGAQWLDEHCDYIITAIRFQYPARAGGEDLTATAVIDLTSPGQLPPEDMRPRLGPWSYGVPPMPA